MELNEICRDTKKYKYSLSNQKNHQNKFKIISMSFSVEFYMEFTNDDFSETCFLHFLFWRFELRLRHTSDQTQFFRWSFRTLLSRIFGFSFQIAILSTTVHLMTWSREVLQGWFSCKLCTFPSTTAKGSWDFSTSKDSSVLGTYSGIISQTVEHHWTCSYWQRAFTVTSGQETTPMT